MRLIYNSDAQRLQKNFDDKTPVTVSELFRSERTASVPIELFLVDNDGGYATPGSSDYEVLIGRQAQAVTTGKLTLTFTGTTEEIDLSKPKLATRIEAALNAVSEVNAAGGVDVVELKNGRAFQITFRSVGSRAAITAGVKDSMQPASVLISEVTAGTGSTREVQLLTLEEASLAEVSTSGWSANSNPALTITTLVEGTANTREVVQLSVSNDPAPGSFFVVSNSEPISTEATAAQVKTILNSALSNDIGSVKKTGERIWQITYKTNGDKTALSAGTHNLVKRPSVNATLSLNTTALAYAANSDGSDLSVGFTLKKSNEVLLSENVDLAEPFAEVIGSSAMLNNDSLGALFTIAGDDVNKGTAISLSGGLTYSSDTLGVPLANYLPLAGGTMTGDALFGDNVKAKFGTDSDLEIYHTGSSSVIHDRGTGGLKIDSNYLQIRDANQSETLAKFTQNGAVELFYNNQKKLETSNDGVVCSGLLQVNGSLNCSGTLTTFDTEHVVVTDPIISLGGTPTTDSNKDVGMELNYYNSGSAKKAAVVWDDSEQAIALFSDATNSSEVFSGTLADLKCGKVLLEDGSASAPSLTFSNDSDLGIYRASSDTLVFSAQGNERFRVSVFGVETSYQVKSKNGTAASPSFAFQGDSTTGIFRADSDSIGFTCNGTEAARFDSSGRFAIGETTPSAYDGDADDLIVKTGGNTGISIRTSSTGKGSIFFADGISGSERYQGKIQYFHSDNSLRFATSATEAARFDSSGHLLLNSTSSTGDLFQSTATDGVFAARLIGSQTSGQSYGLRIRAGFTNADSSMLVENWSGTDLFKITGDGKVGIGGTPNELLQIDGTSPKIRLRDTDASGTPYVHFDASDGNILLSADAGDEIASSNIQFAIDGTEVVRFLSNGLATFNGSGGGALTIGSHIDLGDNQKIRFGTVDDFVIYHDGTDSHIQNLTGDLRITNYADDKDIIFQSDDGSGGVDAYFWIDGSALQTTFVKDLLFYDNVKLNIGTNSDLKIYHDGTNSRLNNETGDFIFTQNADGKDIKFNCDNGSGSVATYFYLDGSASAPGVLYTQFPDDSRLTFGESKDFQIYHSSNATTLRNSGTGHVYLRNDSDGHDFIFQASKDNGDLEEILRLDGSNSRIGVSTSSPRTKFHIVGDDPDDDPTAATAAGAFLVSNSANSYGIEMGVSSSGDGWIQSHSVTANSQYPLLLNPLGGNVGIGEVTSPNALLHVKSTGNGEIEIERASGALINLQAQAARGVIGTDSNHELHIKTNATSQMSISTSGDAEILTDGKGLILSSPDGTRYKITVANDGTVTSTAV